MLSYQPCLQASLLLALYLLLLCHSYKNPLRQWLASRGHGRQWIAYGSETGHAHHLAKELQNTLQQQGQNWPLISLNQLSAKHLQQAKRLLIITSSHGDGAAPLNASALLPRLHKLRQGGHTLHCEFALLALGDKRYAHFCGYGLRLNRELEQLGARALFAPTKVDDLDPNDLQGWQANLQQHGILHGQNPPSLSNPSGDVTPTAMTLLSKQHLNPGSPGNALLELRFKGPLPPWHAGDTVRLHLPGGERDYSIASLPGEQHLRLLVRLRYGPQGNPGLASACFANLQPGQQLPFSVRSNPALHLPGDKRPLILIGNGSGLASLRAQLQQRSQRGHSKNWLIYGERCPQHDRPWHTELHQQQVNGQLRRLHLVYSRAEGDGPEQGYVQDILKREQKHLRRWLRAGARLYLCGSREGMAEGVEQTLQNLLGKRAVARLQAQGRYLRDVY